MDRRNSSNDKNYFCKGHSMVDTWEYFHRFDCITTTITCSRCSKAHHRDYKPFFNVGGELVCYDCVNESSTISYNVKENFPNLKPNKWTMTRSIQHNE